MNKFTKGFITLIVGCSMLSALTGCQNRSQEQAKEQRELKHRQSMGDSESLPSGNYFEDDQRYRAMQSQQKQAIKSVSSQMGQNYKQIANVAPNGNCITTTLKGKQMSILGSALNQGNPSAKKFIKQLTTGLNKTSINVSKQIKDPSLVFQLRNTNNKVIYQVHNGHTDVKKV